MRDLFSRNFFLFQLLLACLLLQVGCATRAVQTVPLPQDKQDHLFEQFASFARQQCPQTLDSDLSLEMKYLGKTEKAKGLLQAQVPSSLRYTTLGPMDRSLFIMVTDGSTFTMVDNRNAKAYTGSVNSNFWHKYLPKELQVKDLLPLLFGRLPADMLQEDEDKNKKEKEYTIIDIRADRDTPDTGWLFLENAAGLHHEISFDPEKKNIIRHRISDKVKKDLLLDVAYDEYDRQYKECQQPILMTVKGKSITGTLTIRFDSIFPDITLAPTSFKLTPPEHFSIKVVE